MGSKPHVGRGPHRTEHVVIAPSRACYLSRTPRPTISLLAKLPNNQKGAEHADDAQNRDTN
jgi:hypothetical protein